MRSLLGFWLLSLIVIAGLASVLSGQTNRSPARVFTGSELGFRLDGKDPQSGRPTGTFVVWMNGHWVEVSEGMRLKPAK